MVDIPDSIVDGLAVPVATAIPRLVDSIPPGPAAELGRLGAPDDDSESAGARSWAARTDPPALAALRELGPLRAERLLGALELTVARLEPTDVPDLPAYLSPPPDGGWFAYASSGHDSEAVTAAAMLEQLRPGVCDLVLSLARRLAAHRSVVPLLSVAPDAADEPAIAARHGAAHLAVAVATACAVVDDAAPAILDRSAAVVGIGIGAAGVLLRESPMPPPYPAALLARLRAEYVLPRQAAGAVPVSGHRFALTEGGVPDQVDFAGNGLVAVVDGGAVIRTGVAAGGVRVLLTVLAEAPAEVEPGWEEVVEVSWRAAEGRASVIGPDGAGVPRLRRTTPPWPGDYRLRVHARGRDDADDPDAESYGLVVWAAPAAPEIVHRRTDRLGHRLRGEPEPIQAARPEHAYRWARRSALSEAATVTVATGASVEEVLHAFGADPNLPEAIDDITEDLYASGSIDPWVAVLDTGEAVLAVEYNGFQGSHEPVLRAASVHGRAASMYWNVNAVTRLSFAERGRLLASFEPLGDVDAGPAVAAAVAGLDFGELGDHTGKGLVAVERFTGRGITAEDLARIETAGIAFRIVPHLPPLYPYHPQMARLPDLDVAALERLPAERLHTLAWWAAAEAARYAGLADDPDVAASVAARALTASAYTRARASQLHGGTHPWLWQALHLATNPDARAALVTTLDAARYAAGPHAAQLLADAQARIAAP